VLTARPAAGPPVGIDLTLTTVNSGEARIEPRGTVVSARALRPGGAASGRLVLRNQTPFKRAFRPTVDGAKDFDRDLRITVTASGKQIYKGTIGGLRNRRRPLLTVASYGAATLELELTVPAGAAAQRLQGLSGQLSLSFAGEKPR
jgi:hypothetical protein